MTETEERYKPDVEGKTGLPMNKFKFAGEQDVIDLRIAVGLVGEVEGKPRLISVLEPESEGVFEGELIKTGPTTQLVKFTGTPTQLKDTIMWTKTIQGNMLENKEKRALKKRLWMGRFVDGLYLLKEQRKEK